MWLVSIERSFQGLFVAIETMRIVKELMEIWPNKVCDRQHVSENNINTTLAALTTQLQQLAQLVANPTLPAALNISPLPVPSPPISPSPALTAWQTHSKLSFSPDFSGEHHNSHAFLNFCSLYIHLVPEQFYNEQEKILWALTFFKGGRTTK